MTCCTTTPEIPVIGGAATNVNRVVYRGDTLFFLDTIYQYVLTKEFFTVPVGQLPPPNSVPFDLTGLHIWFTAKNTIADPDLQAVIFLDNQALGGVVVTNAPGGAFSVTSAPIATSQYPDAETDLFFDIQFRDSSARVFTVEHGRLAVMPDVTRTFG